MPGMSQDGLFSMSRGGRQEWWDRPLRQGEIRVRVGGENVTARRGCVWGDPADQVSCGERGQGAESPAACRK